MNRYDDRPPIVYARRMPTTETTVAPGVVEVAEKLDTSDLKKQLAEAKAKLAATEQPDHSQILGAAVSNGEHIAQYFAYDHLPPNLQEISRPFAELAARVLKLPRNPERTVALRKLIESKDCAVRAALAKP